MKNYYPLLRRLVFTQVICLLALTTIDSQRPSGQRGGGRQAPAIMLTGQVVDGDSQAGLEFATISLFSKRDSSLITGGLSELDGRFEISIQPRPMYAVVEYISYSPKTFDVEIDRDALRSGERKIDLGQIGLMIEGVALDDVVIRAEKSETQFSLDKRVFNVGKDLANQGGSAEDILDNVPSVTVDIEGAVSLRGSSGVRILIDGRPSGLANQDNANGLRSIPANLIDKVEVITNPSARYEAEGMAGIINIVLKKDKGSGFNGSFDGSIGMPGRSGVGANVNYRKGKINWFANAGVYYRTGPGQGSSFLEQTREDETFFQEVTRDLERSGLSQSFRFGFDFLPSDKETLTGAFLYRRSDEDNTGLLTYNDYIDSYPSNLVLTTLRTDDEREDESNLQYSLNFKKEFTNRNHYFEATVQYQDDIEEEGSDFFERASGSQASSIPDLIQRSNNQEANKQWLFQLDFNKPIGKDGKVEVGARTSLRDITNDYVVEEQGEDGSFFNLAGLSNDFVYDENVHAAYVIYGNKIGKFGYQLGNRVEYSDILTELRQTNEVNPRDYFNYFPSTFLNYEFAQGSNAQVSYSRRIRRPRFWDLNPFFTFSDSRNTFSGNPNLDPEFTDSYEVNYIRVLDDITVTGGLFYRHTTDVIQRILEFNPDGTTNRIPQNLATSDDYGVELTFQYSGIKWLRLDGNANFFRQQVNGQNFDTNFSAETTTWFGRFTSRASFWNSDLQLRFNYRAPRETVQGRTNGIPSLDLGWSKDVMQKKGTLTLSVRDIFNSRRRAGVTIGENFFRESEFQWRARSITLSFNYRVNQKKQRQRGGRGGGDFEGGGEF